jgi:hypothetical protein
VRQTSTTSTERNEASEDSSEDSGEQSSEGGKEEQVLGDLSEATGGDTVDESSKVLC